MFVIERMATDLITIGPDLTIGEAKKIMSENSIRHLPVIDDKGLLIGIVTDRDMRDAMPSTLKKKADYEKTLETIKNYKIQDIMTRDLLTIYPYYTIQDTLLVIQKKKVGALPVVDEEGRLKGILSTRDLLTAFVNVMGIDEPGSLLCILVEDKRGQMKKVIDIITEENISLGSVLTAKSWSEDKRAIFPYLHTNNVINVKKKLVDIGCELIDPMKWYLDHSPQKAD
ncbi:MAG: CBS domain-containing protein [Deltaproteobacteria bacterium]|nr:CBS domain-containing protein [Deltaproteobacteria bacterium]